SAALTEAYGCRAPVVVYNSFPADERTRMDGKTRDRKNMGIPSLIWFSQVIGPGRGLEALLDCLVNVSVPFELHLRGRCDKSYAASLLSRATSEWRSRIHLHQQVPASELLSRLAEHDLAYAGDLPFARSRDLTITNKAVQYLLAGLPVIASDTVGHREAARHAPDAVTLSPAGDPAALAQVINSTLSDTSALRAARNAALEAAGGFLSWENSEVRLIAAVDKAIGV